MDWTRLPSADDECRVRRWTNPRCTAPPASPNHAGMTELLLAAGADPDDRESIYHACEHFDTTIDELLSGYPFTPL